MRVRVMLALACALFAVAGMWMLAGTNRPDAAAAGNFRVFIPGLSSSSSAAPTPTPTPTPIGGGSPGTLSIYVEMEITGQEPNTDPDGMVDIPIFAAATARLPDALDPPVTVTGTVTIAPHPVDAAGCTWSRTYASDNFTMTVSPPAAGSNGITLSFEAPEWHYTISCPPVGVVTRLPSFGEQQMLAFLGYTFPEYVPPAGIPLDVPPVSVLPDCIKREATFHRTADLADAVLHVVIYEAPCLLPLP